MARGWGIQVNRESQAVVFQIKAIGKIQLYFMCPEKEAPVGGSLQRLVHNERQDTRGLSVPGTGKEPASHSGQHAHIGTVWKEGQVFENLNHMFLLTQVCSLNLHYQCGPPNLKWSPDAQQK